MSSVTISMDLTHVPLHLPQLLEVECPRCAEPLNLHQPELFLPQRMLGTCCECSAWYLIEGATGLMLLLPDAADLLNAENEDT